MACPPAAQVLDEATWQVRRAAHEARVDEWTAPHLERRRRGEPHPVEDFLFTYYSHRPAALRRWHPGFGVALTGPSAADYVGLKGYAEVSTSSTGRDVSTGRDAGAFGVSTSSTSRDLSTGRDVVAVSVDYVRSQRPLLEALYRLLRATAARPAQLGCFGMHEWAMVYRLGQSEVRHADWPLRLGQDGTDAVVEGHRISCSHFDAFRFFTDAARPLNRLRPRSDDREAYEQPGCLHAGMDLYKHAYRLSPMVGSEVVADCFALARDIRVLDMRASPYDLSGLGYPPVRVETPEGKQEYVAAQREFAERGAPLRARLVGECERLLEVASAKED
ncbi:MAG TPA: 3-methyladenine DNA glycosylase [Nocardioidaceae bacterium]|nr:3-methyladenine DNA glycosylase [Nocardioidaceae bacterium]